MTQSLPMPVDVRLMKMTASVLFMVFALLLVGALAGWALRHPVFAVRGIAVTGDVAHHNAVTLRANVAPRLSGTFFTMDLGAAQRTFEALPWVRRAVVRREFPNRLHVVLEEHRAVAYWGAEGESRLLNNFGEVFEANVGEVEQDYLPRLNGPQGQAPQVLAMYQTLNPHFEALDMPLEQVELNGHGGWRVRSDTGAVIELGGGSSADILARTQQFLRSLTQVTSRYGRKPEALAAADLRHKDGYAVRLDGVTTVIPNVPKTVTK
jgi:cell division protein FtsQ